MDIGKLTERLDTEFPGASNRYVRFLICSENITAEKLAGAIIKSAIDENNVFAGGITDRYGFRWFAVAKGDSLDCADLENELNCPVIGDAVWEDYYDTGLRIGIGSRVEKCRLVEDSSESNPADWQWRKIDIIHFRGYRIGLGYGGFKAEDLEDFACRREITREEADEVEI